MNVGGYNLELVKRIESSVGATFVKQGKALLVASSTEQGTYELELIQLSRFKSLRRGAVAGAATVTRVGEDHALLMLPDMEGKDENRFELRGVDDFDRVVSSFVESKPGHVAANPDGSRIAVAHDFGDLHVRDARTGELVWKYASKGVGGVAYSPDGSLLAAREFAGALKFFDAADPGPKPLRSTKLGSGTTVAFHPSEPLVAAADKQAIRVVDASTAKVRAAVKLTKKESAGAVKRMSYSPDGSLLVTATRRGNVVGLWDMEQEEFLGHVAELKSMLNGVEFDARGEHLLISSYGGAELYSIKPA